MSSFRRPILEEAGLLRAFRVQCRVIGALVMREMHTRFGRQNLGYLWLFMEPMILAGSVAVIQNFIGHGIPGGMSPFTFFVLGYTPYYLLRSILGGAVTALEGSHSLMYHARVTLLDVLVARSLLEGAAVMVALSVFLIAHGVFTGVWPQNPTVVALGVVAMTLLVHGAALLVCAATAWGARNVERVVHPLTYLTIPISGSFFMVWWLPDAAKHFALMVPTVHIYEIMREGYYGAIVPYYYDVGYLLTWVVVSNVLGMLALRVAEPHLEP